MRLTMSFEVTERDVRRRVLTGPAYGWNRASHLFALMGMSHRNLVEGTMPIPKLVEGLGHARAELALEGSHLVAHAERFDVTRADLSKMVDSLSTWSSTASIKGASHIAWREDF